MNGNNAAQTNLHNNTEGGESSVKGSGDCS